MSRIDELRQQIDACRTGSEDLHLPELAGLAQAIGQDGGAANSIAADSAVAREFDRSQRFDRSVVSALQDVSVPTGLLERLLAKTAAASPDNAAAATLGTVVSAAVDPSASVPTGERVTVIGANRGTSRRRWMMSLGAAGLIAASTIAVAFVFWPVSPREISLAQLAADIPKWNDAVKANAGWQVSPPASVMHDFPVVVLRQGNSSVVKWRRFPGARGERGVVYDVTPHGGARAVLFVIATPHHYVGVAPAPLTTIPGMTGGISVGTWQRPSGLLYVLVVEQGGLPLMDYFRSAPVG